MLLVLVIHLSLNIAQDKTAILLLLLTNGLNILYNNEQRNSIMEQASQSLVHTRNRPIRVAFVVDTSNKTKALTQVEKIIQYASRKWGGRFYQIIPAPGGNVSNAWIEYLTQYDPDFIHSKTELSVSTLKKVALRLNPSFCEVDERDFISLHPDPLDVVPDAKNSTFLWRNPFQEYSIFDLSISNEIEPPAYVRKFIKFNFGQLSSDYLTKQLTDDHVVRENVTSKASLINGMRPLADWGRHIYPLEYSFIPGVDGQIRRDYDDDEVRTLFIGDDPLDVIYYWNNALRTPDWLSCKKVNAWIPTKFVTDDQLLSALRGWIDKFRATGNSNDPYKLNIRSSSVNLATLRVYARKVSENLYYTTDTQKISEPLKISYQKNIALTSDMESYSVSGSAFNISIKPVEQMQGGMLGQRWMTDFFIEQDNPNSRIVNPDQYWLLFPKYNALACRTLKNQIGSRISRSGQPSAFMGRDMGMISIVIPDDRTVLNSILLGARHFSYHNGDSREGVLKPAFSNYRYSQSGRSLRGFVNLFGGFMEASHFFENPYWRRVFMTMAGVDPTGDTSLNRNLRSVLEKNLKKVINQGDINEKAVDAWVSRVQKYSRDIKLEGQEKNFSFFESEFLEEIEEYNKTNEENIKYTDRNRRGLKDNISNLIDINMIKIGIRHKCHHCGLKSFYEVSEVKPHNECVGCGAVFTIDAEQQWHYQLNTIAGVNGAIYSQIPLIVALGALYEKSRYSFDPYPPIDVFVGKKQRHLTDLDIFVLLDGGLVIGEVKNVQTLFTDGDFDKLHKAAKLLRPDTIVLSSLDKTPDVNNQKRIADLQSKLNNYGVKVEWLNLPSLVFELYPQGVWSW